MDSDPMIPSSATGTPGVGTPSPDTGVVLSEERLVAATQWRPARRLRVSKTVVTEEQTITVTVRREEVVVEELPLGDLPGDPAPLASASAGPVLEMVLAREVVQLVTVPHERVRVVLDRVAGVREVSADVAREEVDVEVLRTGLDGDHRP